MSVNIVDLPDFETYEFRKIFLRPTLTGEEKLLVGVLVQTGTETKALVLQSPSVLSKVEMLYGSKGRERYIHIANSLQEKVIRFHGKPLSDLESPDSALIIGALEKFVADNPIDQGWSLLRSAASLSLGITEKILATARHTISNETLLSELNLELSRLDVIAGTRVFKGGEFGAGTHKIRIPILGNKIIASQVSFVTTRIEQAKNFAEASLAKLSYAKREVKQTPYLYTLLPQLGSTSYERVEEAFGEFLLLADSFNMKVRSDSSVQNLAQSILFDERAA